MQSADKSLAASVEITLAELDLQVADTAVARLAVTYATALDQAAAISKQADRVLERAYREADRTELIDEVAALRAKLGERTALQTIGARLEAVLTDLVASPAARAKLEKAKPATVQAPASGGSALAALRQARARHA